MRKNVEDCEQRAKPHTSILSQRLFTCNVYVASFCMSAPLNLGTPQESYRYFWLLISQMLAVGTKTWSRDNALLSVCSSLSLGELLRSVVLLKGGLIGKPLCGGWGTAESTSMALEVWTLMWNESVWNSGPRSRHYCISCYLILFSRWNIRGEKENTLE